MRISLIAAMTTPGLIIGNKGSLPAWRLPDDMKLFRKLTSSYAIIMGRKTHQSIGKPLPNRANIVITTNRDFNAQGCLIAYSLDQALLLAQEAKVNHDQVFIIGGEEIYNLALPHTTKIYQTLVEDPNGDLVGDTHFPVLNIQDWVVTNTSFHPADDRHSHSFTFRILNRI